MKPDRANPTILLVDDEATARYGTRRALESRYQIVEASSAAEARAGLAAAKPDLILLDMVMPGEDGLELLRSLRASGNHTPVLVVSALDTASTAVEALRSGAQDYIVKGFDIEELRHRVASLLHASALGSENAQLRRELIGDGQFGRMIGSSSVMRRVFEMADRVAATDATVLILGESGTGKDLLAQEIHERSPRAGKPFVAVNCAALPETLIESELFGFERGAFTGAAQQRKGKFEMASGGTLFLDEIGDMNPVTQAKVLRALENRKIERLGGSQSIDVDVRVISATHRDLPGEIAAGRFREDLYYRIRVVSLVLPALREHPEDIPMLAASFLRQVGARHGRDTRLSAPAMDTLKQYSWPGNVRELRNALETTLVMSRGSEIGISDLPEEIRTDKPAGARSSAHAAAATPHAGNGTSADTNGATDFREAKKQFEIVFLKRKLEEHRWNVSKTAEEIGLHRQSLQEKLRELGIQRPVK